MKQVITIQGKQITIRGVKLKEIKEFSGMVGDKIEALFQVLDSDDLFAGLQQYFVDNLDSIAKIIEQFTDLSSDQIDDMEIVELTELVRELMKINGISVEKTLDFFTKVLRVIHSQPDEPEKPIAFAEPIPDGLM